MTSVCKKFWSTTRIDWVLVERAACALAESLGLGAQGEADAAAGARAYYRRGGSCDDSPHTSGTLRRDAWVIGFNLGRYVEDQRSSMQRQSTKD